MRRSSTAVAATLVDVFATPGHHFRREVTPLISRAKLPLAVAIALLACKKHEGETPESVAKVYLEALRTGQWEKAWDSATAADREARPIDDFRDVPKEAETLRKAMEPLTKHTIVSTKVDGDRATVEVDVETPELAPDGVKPDAPLKKNRSSLRLVREDKKWKVDTDWAEAKEAEARRRRVEELKLDAARAFGSGDSATAKKKLEETLSIAPDDSEAKEALASVEADLKTIVAGNWRLMSQRDAMTDDENVFVALRAATPVEKFGKVEFPFMVVRCAERKLDAFINTHMTIDSDYGEIYLASGRYRIDEQPAKRVRFGLGDSRDTVFFTRSRDWITLLGANAQSKLAVEVPVYGEGPRVLVFELAGADVAVKKVLDACAPR